MFEASWESGFFGTFFSFSFSFDLNGAHLRPRSMLKVPVCDPYWEILTWKRFTKGNHFQIDLKVWSAIRTGMCISYESTWIVSKLRKHLDGLEKPVAHAVRHRVLLDRHPGWESSAGWQSKKGDRSKRKQTGRGHRSSQEWRHGTSLNPRTWASAYTFFHYTHHLCIKNMIEIVWDLASWQPSGLQSVGATTCHKMGRLIIDSRPNPYHLSIAVAFQWSLRIP